MPPRIESSFWGLNTCSLIPRPAGSLATPSFPASWRPAPSPLTALDCRSSCRASRPHSRSASWCHRRRGRSALDTPRQKTESQSNLLQNIRFRSGHSYLIQSDSKHYRIPVFQLWNKTILFPSRYFFWEKWKIHVKKGFRIMTIREEADIQFWFG